MQFFFIGLSKPMSNSVSTIKILKITFIPTFKTNKASAKSTCININTAQSGCLDSYIR